ncbi:MAG: 4-hydroxyphenylacetate decarboxylase small subunit [Ignavibacteria bacterium]|nr:4-hydroxyphenylacetate decarboxylase small subunit [Ignavibacteria bacterium]
MEFKCKDCKFYLAIDVFKGICKLDQKRIFPDDVKCMSYEKIPKCKFCSNFTEEKENLGSCMKNYPAYPDMTAINCQLFQWK